MGRRSSLADKKVIERGAVRSKCEFLNCEHGGHVRKLVQVIVSAIMAATFLSACGDNDKPHNQNAEVARPAPLTDPERTALVARATTGAAVERDKIEKITFYTPKSNDDYHGPRMSAYISLPDNVGPIFRVIFRFVGDEWIFFDHVKILSDDQIIFDKSFPYNDIHRSNGAGWVLESLDKNADAELLNAVRRIAKAKAVTVRLSGSDHRQDFDVTADQRKQLAETLRMYDELQPLSR